MLHTIMLYETASCTILQDFRKKWMTCRRWNKNKEVVTYTHTVDLLAGIWVIANLIPHMSKISLSHIELICMWLFLFCTLSYSCDLPIWEWKKSVSCTSKKDFMVTISTVAQGHTACVCVCVGVSVISYHVNKAKDSSERPPPRTFDPTPQPAS